MLKALLVALLLSLPAFAQGTLAGVPGDCTIGGQQALTSGLPSTATQQIGTQNVLDGAGVMASFPKCFVTVYNTGTLIKAVIFQDNLLSPTPSSNPFTANIDGSYQFFVAPGSCYDIVISTGTGPSLPYSRTLSDVCIGTGTGTGSGNVIGTMTPGLFPLAIGVHTLGDSGLFDDGTSIGNASPRQWVWGNATCSSLNANTLNNAGCSATQNSITVKSASSASAILTRALNIYYQGNGQQGIPLYGQQINAGFVTDANSSASAGLTGLDINAIVDGGNVTVPTLYGIDLRPRLYNSAHVGRMVYIHGSANNAVPVGTTVDLLQGLQIGVTVNGTATQSTGLGVDSNQFKYGILAAGINLSLIADDTHGSSASGICHGAWTNDFVTIAGHDCWYGGAGSPEGVVTANIGSIYSRQDGGSGTSLYIKQVGSGNTGWIAVTAGSGVSGSGTPAHVPVWNTATSLGDSDLSLAGDTLTALNGIFNLSTAAVSSGNAFGIVINPGATTSASSANHSGTIGMQTATNSTGGSSGAITIKTGNTTAAILGGALSIGTGNSGGTAGNILLSPGAGTSQNGVVSCGTSLDAGCTFVLNQTGGLGFTAITTGSGVPSGPCSVPITNPQFTSINTLYLRSDAVTAATFLYGCVSGAWSAISGSGGGGSGNVSAAGTLPVNAVIIGASPAAQNVSFVPVDNVVTHAFFAGSSSPGFRAILPTDIPLLNQNTNGTSSNITGIAAIANGGTNANNAVSALNNLLPAQGGNNGKLLGTDGTNASWTTAGTGTVTTTGSPLTGQCAIMSGATSITSNAGCLIDGSGNVTVNTINTTGTASPDIFLQITTPLSPPLASNTFLFASSADSGRMHDENSSGVIGTTSVAKPAVANQFLTSMSAAGIFTSAQPNFSDLAGTTNLSQVPLFVVNQQSATYLVTPADFLSCKTIPVPSGTFTITLVAVGSQPPTGQCVKIINYGTGVVTVARSGQSINGSATNITLAAGSASAPNGLEVISDGSNYTAQPLGGTGGGGGSSALSAITAATSTNTIASGDNGGQIWNWAMTTAGRIAMTFGETTAATSTGTPYIVKMVTLAGSTASPLNLVNSLSGSQTLCTLCITPTWNTSGVVDAAILLNVTNTGSGAGSLLQDWQVGGTSVAKLDKGGNFTLTGATGGYSAFGQGSDNSSIANAAMIEAPASVTAYRLQVPAANPVNNNSAWLHSNATPSVGTFAKMPSISVLTSAYTNATTTFSNLSAGNNLSFAVEANTQYRMTCSGSYQGSATTAGLKMQITGPSSPTQVGYQFHNLITASTFTDGVATAFSSSLGTGTITATTNFLWTLTMDLANGANAGTVQVQAAAVGTGTVTINSGSCQLQ